MPRLNHRLPQVFALLVLTALLCPGCVSSDHADMASRAASNEPTGLPIEPADASAVGFTPNWAVGLGLPPRQRLGAAVILGDLLVTVERPKNMVTAVNASTGEVQWRSVVGTPGEPLYTPFRRGDRVFVNSATRVFTLSARSGNRQHIDPLDHTVAAGPVLINDIAVFGGVGGRVFGYDTDAGHAVWEYQLAQRILTPPIAVGDSVFAADAGGVYALLNATTGHLLWRSRTFGSVSATPASDGQQVYVPSKDRSLYVINRSSGRDAWIHRATAALTEPPVVLGNTCYLPVPGEGLVALNSADGALLWKLDNAPTPLLLHEGKLLAYRNNSLQLIDPDTGRIDADAPCASLFKVLPGPDNSIIMVTRRGRMLRLTDQP